MHVRIKSVDNRKGDGKSKGKNDELKVRESQILDRPEKSDGWLAPSYDDGPNLN